MLRNRQAREQYRPKKVKLLFIAESPPMPGESELDERYFYRPSTRRPSHLLKYITIAMYGEEVFEKQPEEQLLRRFCNDGCFLIDVSEQPVNKLSLRDRYEAIENALEGLVRRVREISPERIIVIKKSIFEQVGRVLTVNGYGERILGEGLPFPSHGHQRRFVRELRELLNHPNLRAFGPRSYLGSGDFD